MTANPLKVVARQPQRSAHELVERGNAILAGHMPMEHGKNAGQFMHRADVRWVLRDGRCVIELV